MRRGSSSWLLVLAMAMAMAPAACAMDFPSATQSHAYTCHLDSDCIDGFTCGSDCKCDSASEQGVGTCTGGGTDGGTSGCAQGLVVAPTIIDGNTTTTVSLSLPPGVQAVDTDPVTLDGANVGTVTQGSSPDPAVVRYELTLGPNVPVGVGKVLTVSAQHTGSQPTCYQTTVDVRGETQSSNLTVSPNLVDQDQAQTVHLVFQQLAQALDPKAPIQVFARDESAQPPVVYVLPDAQVMPPSGGGPPDTVAVQVAHLPPDKGYRLVALVGARLGQSAPNGLYVAKGRPPHVGRVNPTRFLGSASTVSMALEGQGLGPDVSAALACGAGSKPGNWVPIQKGATTTEAGVTFSVSPQGTTKGVPCALYYRQLPPGAQSGGLVRKLTGLVAYGKDLAAWTTPNVATQNPHVEPGAAVVTLPDGSRYLVVVGGRPASAGAFPSTRVELSPLGDFGAPEGFSPGPDLPKGLQAPAVATWGNMVYVVGGFDDQSSASKVVYRSELLEESDRPQGLTAGLVRGSGIQGGTPPTDATGDTVLYYAVSVLRDPSSRGAEGPVSLPVRVVIPQGVTATVSLAWMDDPSATGYRVFRGPDPGSLHHLAVPVPTTGMGGQVFVEDDGTAASDQVTPFQPGRLSPWSPDPGPLPAPVGAAAAVVVPSATGGAPTLMVAGGADSPVGSATKNVYQADIIMTPGLPDQTLGTFTQASFSLGAARDHLQGRVLDWGFSDATQQPEPTVVFGPGQQPAGGPMAVDSVTPSQGNAMATTSDDQPLTPLDGPALFLGYTGDASSASFLADMVGNQTPASERSVSFGVLGTGVPAFSAPWSGIGTVHPTVVGPLRASAQAAGFCYLVGGGLGDPTGGSEVDFTVR